METIKVINYVIMVIFFACYAYQFLYIPIAWLKKQKATRMSKLEKEFFDT